MPVILGGLYGSTSFTSYDFKDLTLNSLTTTYILIGGESNSNDVVSSSNNVPLIYFVDKSANYYWSYQILSSFTSVSTVDIANAAVNNVRGFVLLDGPNFGFLTLQINEIEAILVSGYIDPSASNSITRFSIAFRVNNSIYYAFLVFKTNS